MSWPLVIFWLALSVLLLTYVGYPVMIWVWNNLRRGREANIISTYQPNVSLIIPVFNEAPILEAKWKNCLELNYPKDKLEVVFVTDGSSDGSDELAHTFLGATCIHRPERLGKTAAINRSIGFVKGDVLVFNDANTLLNPESIQHLTRHFHQQQIGGVSGEKSVMLLKDGNASATGEGLYWKYESWLKEQDAQFYALIGSAGELFAVRRELYQPIPEDTVLDDFYCSVDLLHRGYLIAYEPKAKALEAPSLNFTDEWKRKVRISAGAWQVMRRQTYLFNPLANFRLSLLFYFHRFSRWVLAPWALLALIFYNPLWLGNKNVMDQIVGSGFIAFWMLVLVGYFLRNKARIPRLIQLCFYFAMMHAAQIAGLIRFLRGMQAAAWDKAERRVEHV